MTIEATDMITRVDGAMCRVWRGVTEGGIACDLAISLIRVKVEADRSQFEQELVSMPEPRSDAMDMRYVW